MPVDWTAIGAIGEILGAAGVMTTLIYLAVQVRQNSRQLERSIEATRVSADDAITRGFDRWRDLLIGDEVVSSIYLRGMADLRELDPTERLRFNFILTSFTWTAWQLWRVQNLLGTPNAEILRHLLRHRGGRDWYLANRDYYPPDFRVSVDAVLEDLESKQVPFLEPHESSSMFSGPVAESDDLTGAKP